MRILPILVLAVVGLGTVAVHADDWPQWRGPGATGIGDGRFPDRWTASERVAWKTPIPGRGHSSPVVSGSRLFVTTSIQGAEIPGWKAPEHLGYDGKMGYVNEGSIGVGYVFTLKVYALDVTTGKILWERTAYEGSMYDDRHRKNTYASSTVATDGQLVYAFFESAGLYAYDIEGALKWKQDLGGMAKAGLGPGTSPLIHEKLLILQCDQEMGEGSFLVALDRFTGREIWRVKRTNRRSWATPIVVTASGRQELIAAGAESIAAYDPATGAILWTAPGTKSHPIPSYVVGHGLVYASAGSQDKVLLALRPGQQDEASRVAWRYNKGTAYVPSPILYGDYLYLMTDTGIMTCLDAKTGTVVYEGGRVPVPATFTASPVAFDGKILITSEDGDTFVIKAGPEHEVLATNSIDEPVYASMALARGMLFIRGERHVMAIK